MSSMRVTIILPPWMQGRAEREALGQAGESIAAGAEIDLIEFTGAPNPAALAALAANALQPAARRLVLLPAGAEGEQAAALIAAALDGVPLGRCTYLAIEGEAVVARRAVFGGRAEIETRSEAALACATLRPDESRSKAGAVLPQARSIAIEETGFQSEAVAAAATHPRLEGAPLVVSGGRGIGASEGFDLLARIAHLLGAGLGGSLPAVDAGWVPVAHQVGQSGKFVSPRMYFAVAISGTPQHLAGIAPGVRIVALNNDKEAPIFSRCDVGVVGDWREILPLVASQLEATAADH